MSIDYNLGDEAEKLLNYKEFREFFSARKIEKWNVRRMIILYTLYTNIKDILNKFELFNRELDTVVLLCSLKNKNAYNEFKNLYLHRAIFLIGKLR
ncbi:MAG: hypothetical protein Nk1A_4250 [Endomicrobiia bacterium]|nr:MAG: hypothetical protein Nk1A_4250 [Endomicrobiia bacterium]